MTRDPQFGPMLMFGLGGIFVEVMKDVTFHLAPITAGRGDADAGKHAVLRAAEGRARRGRRGPRRHRHGLQRISQLATDFPEIVELDINPFIVGELGTESVAADARITLTRRRVHHERERNASPQYDPNWQETYREHDRHGRGGRQADPPRPARLRRHRLRHSRRSSCARSSARGRELSDTSRSSTC